MQGEQSQNIQQWINEEGYLINPTPEVIREIATTVSPDEGRVNILVDPEILRDIDREYTTASELARLNDEGTLSIRTLEGDYQTNLLVAESATGAFIDLDGLTAAIGSRDGELTSRSTEIAEQLWDEGASGTLRTPSAEDVKDSFEEYLADEVYEEFLEAVLSMEQEAQTDSNPGEFTYPDRTHTYASLLVAGAVTKSSLRELARCAESCRLASRSTMSRIKTEIEESGYITTSPLDTDVGRPPMQLQRAGLYAGDDATLLAERVYNNLQRTDEGLE